MRTAILVTLLESPAWARHGGRIMGNGNGAMPERLSLFTCLRVLILGQGNEGRAGQKPNDSSLASLLLCFTRKRIGQLIPLAELHPADGLDSYTACPRPAAGRLGLQNNSPLD